MKRFQSSAEEYGRKEKVKEKWYYATLVYIISTSPKRNVRNSAFIGDLYSNFENMSTAISVSQEHL